MRVEDLIYMKVAALPVLCHDDDGRSRRCEAPTYAHIRLQVSFVP